MSTVFTFTRLPNELWTPCTISFQSGNECNKNTPALTADTVTTTRVGLKKLHSSLNPHQWPYT